MNGVEPNAHRFVRSDVEKFLPGDRGTYDLAAIEVSSLDGHVTLLGLLACRMAPSGVAYLVTRAPRPKLDVEALSEWSVEDVTAESLPEDFRSRRIHRVWRLVSRVTEREELINLEVERKPRCCFPTARRSCRRRRR